MHDPRTVTQRYLIEIAEELNRLGDEVVFDDFAFRPARTSSTGRPCCAVADAAQSLRSF